MAGVRAEEAKPEGTRDEGALQGMRERAHILTVQGEINLPDVRWKARNGLGEHAHGVFICGRKGLSNE